VFSSNKFYFSFFSIMILFSFSTLFAADETLAITTYYPSPYGNYNTLAIGTTAPYAKLDIWGYSGATWNSPANAAILVTSTYTDSTYLPGIYWRTTNNNPTYAKAGLFLGQSGTGTVIYLYNSNNYASGMTGGAYLNPGASSWGFSSDARLKTNIKDLSNGLDIITRLNPVSFNWKNEVGKTNKLRFGLLAQDVLKVLPGIVDNNANPNKEGIKYYGTNYGDLIPFLISAVKEQQKEIEGLKEEVQQLKRKKK
jgi:hypothetical protein